MGIRRRFLMTKRAGRRFGVKAGLSGCMKGFTLVELMVVVAIVSILASVAIPAYVNSVNRIRQGNAALLLMTARLEMEDFYLDNNRYASTIGCLASFNSTPACLANCAGCADVLHQGDNYSFFVAIAAQTYFMVASTRLVFAGVAEDVLTVSSRTWTPTVWNEDALKFSLIRWMFE